MCCHICPRGQDCRRNHGKTRTKRQEAGTAGWGGGDFNSYPAAVPRIVMSTTDKNGANLSLETFIFAISRSIDVALILIPDRCTKKREKKSLRAARVHMPVRVRPSTRKNERASERTSWVYLSEWRFLGGQISLGEDNAPSPSHSMPISIPPGRPTDPCMPCMPISVYLSICLSAHALCSADSHLGSGAGARVFRGRRAISAAGIRRNCSFRRPSETFLEYFVTRGLRFAGPLPPAVLGPAYLICNSG